MSQDLRGAAIRGVDSTPTNVHVHQAAQYTEQRTFAKTIPKYPLSTNTLTTTITYMYTERDSQRT
jgi:hypothetical protein